MFKKIYVSIILLFLFQNVFASEYWDEVNENADLVCDWEIEDPTTALEYLTTTYISLPSILCQTYFYSAGAYTSTTSPWVLYALNDYINRSYDNIAEESSKGESGPHHFTIIKILGCSPDSLNEFTTVMNKNYDYVFSDNKKTSLEVTNNLLHVSGKNSLLTDECQYI